jgi:hypothetical protein
MVEETPNRFWNIMDIDLLWEKVEWLWVLLLHPEYQIYLIVLFFVGIFLFAYLVKRFESILAPLIVGIVILLYVQDAFLKGDLSILLNPPILFFGGLLVLGIILGFRYYSRLHGNH